MRRSREKVTLSSKKKRGIHTPARVKDVKKEDLVRTKSSTQRRVRLGKRR